MKYEPIAVSEQERKGQIASRTFSSGATRNSNINPDTGMPKLEYSRFFDPQVLWRRAEYMNNHRILEDGSLREPDNWKCGSGIPETELFSSLSRHYMEAWLHYEAGCSCNGEDIQDTLCAIMFGCEALLRGELRK